jgi:hypothetical protein
MVWFHSSRNLNELQRIFLCNTFILSKLLFLVAILPATNQMLARATSAVGLFIKRDHALRIAFHQLILPVNRGGQNLQSKPMRFFWQIFYNIAVIILSYKLFYPLEIHNIQFLSPTSFT